ncbi:MAG: hypothetical protein ACUVV3_03480 [Dehalococcoidia bacterium]
MRHIEENMAWPDPVPCRPENPVQGIRQCVALRTGTLCPWLHVNYCGVRLGDMQEAFEALRLDEHLWLLEDDVDAADLGDGLAELEAALQENRGGAGDYSEELASVRWFVKILREAARHGCGLSSRFGERLETRHDRY